MVGEEESCQQSVGGVRVVFVQLGVVFVQLGVERENAHLWGGS